MVEPRPGVVSPHRVVFHSYALLVAAAVAYAAYMVPLNVNDSLKHLFFVETHDFFYIVYRDLINALGGADWRPLHLPLTQLTYKYLAQGHEHLVFKGILVACVFLTVGLFVRVLEVKSWPDVLAAAIALLVLLGHHSFGGAVEAVYPYGVEIVLLVCQFAVLNILLAREATRAGEIAAFSISVFAIVFKEMGGFVGATYILGSMLRLPGGTLRSAGALFAAYLAVVCYRFMVSPPSELLAKGAFREHFEVVLSAAAPVLNILISDPRVGQFVTIPQAVAGKPWAIIYFTSSLFLSILILVWAWSTSRQADESYRQEHKVAVIFLVVLLGSAMFGPFSNKDYVPIVALAMYSVVSFYALRWFFAEALQVKRLAVYAVLVALAAGFSLSWSVRAAGLIYYLRQVSFAYQREWAFGLDRLARTHEFSPSITQPLIARLRPEALSPPLNHPHLVYPRMITHFMRGRDCPEACQLR